MSTEVVTIDQLTQQIRELPAESLPELAKYIELIRSRATGGTVGDWQAAGQPDALPTDFLQEVSAFEQLKPTLLKEHGGRVVAIYQGQVVAVGDDKLQVLELVFERLGPMPCYIEWVKPCLLYTSPSPRDRTRSRMPSSA